MWADLYSRPVLYTDSAWTLPRARSFYAKLEELPELLVTSFFIAKQRSRWHDQRSVPLSTGEGQCLGCRL